MPKRTYTRLLCIQDHISCALIKNRTLYYVNTRQEQKKKEYQLKKEESKRKIGY